jgi:hypothetical protein
MVMPLKPKNAKKVNASITFDPKTIDIIDRERRDIPRSVWLNNLILSIFDEGEQQ